MNNQTILRLLGISLSLLLLTGCLGNTEGETITPGPAPAKNNSVPVTINPINRPVVSITLCSPGDNKYCQTIDNILVDTGSTGLRLMAGAVNSALLTKLPYQTQNDQIIAECAQFVSGYAWGTVRTATMQMGGETATKLPIQIIGDPIYSTTPTTCGNLGNEINSAATLGSNGIIGLGLTAQDCGNYCSQTVSNGAYYVCPNTDSCTFGAVPVEQQVSHPVLSFNSSDNNGIMLELPSIVASGAPTATGTLYFGIASQGNNGLGQAQAYIPVVDSNGLPVINTLYDNINYSSFIDSGSNVLFFKDRNLNTCQDPYGNTWYCPANPTTRQATISSGNSSNTFNFTLINPLPLFHATSHNNAIPGLGSIALSLSGTTYFNWGLPFFYGRRVFIAPENTKNPLGTGPMYIF